MGFIYILVEKIIHFLLDVLEKCPENGKLRAVVEPVFAFFDRHENPILFMEQFDSDTTGIPVMISVDIFFDKAKNQYKRILVQLTYSKWLSFFPAELRLDINRLTHPFLTLLRPGRRVKQSDLAQAETFARNNNFALRAVADQILFNEDFCSVVIQGGQAAPEKVLHEAKEKTKELIRAHISADHFAPCQIKTAALMLQE